MSRSNQIGDPSLFIALAAENGAAAQRDADAWGVVADLARAVSLKELGDTASRNLAREFEQKGRNDLHALMTNVLYAGVPVLAETNPHLHQIITTLLEAV